MAIQVHTNVTSLAVQRALGATQSNLAESVAKLSTGFRINSASDDAAGLAISEEFKSNIRSLQQASRNGNDAVSLLQTMDGALNETTDILSRMRELAMQSSSDGVNDTQRGYIQVEITELQNELDRMVSVAEYNGTSLLDGTLNADFQIGLDAGETLSLTLGTPVDSAGLGVDAANFDVSTKAGASAALALADTALQSVAGVRAEIGGKLNRVDHVLNTLNVQIETLSAANGRIRDVDVAAETARMTKNQILVQAGTSMLAQANSMPQVALSLLGG
ncbi:MAG: flagellin FliC [Myxococcales bacterium]|nr:flagellin FliC [Myxococcales bacterium]